MPSFNLAGKTALVTGCKRGIGFAMAEGLAEAGADIIGVSASLRPDSAIERAVTALGREFSGYQCDFGDRAALYAFVETVKRDHGTPDILINNAGTIKRNPAAEHSDDYWDTVVAVNQTAPFLLSREFGRDMIARGSGKIIFTASLLTFQGGITVPGYAASKGAIGQLTMALSNVWAAKGGTGERHRPRLRPHRQYAGAAGQRRALGFHPGPYPGRALGAAGRLQGTHRFPRELRRGLRHRHRAGRGRRLDGPLTVRVTANSAAAAHTVDCIVFGFAAGELRVLLVKRTVEPFSGSWVLPGGAMGPEESLEATARRTLLELVGVKDLYLRQVGTYSDPNRHPVRRVVTTSYYALVKPELHHPVARDYVREASWHTVSEVPPLGFDHDQLLADAHARLTLHLRTRPLAFDLLPEKFTLSEAQLLYQEILGEELDRRNFRRKLLTYDFLVETNEKRSGVKGGPVLYRVDREALERELRQ